MESELLLILKGKVCSQAHVSEVWRNGKKLGFITQEIGREINTIGSKSNFAEMQKFVVQLQDELETIKEQNLNVL